MADPKVTTEEIQAQGEEIITKVRELIRQGGIRRVSVKNPAGQTVVDIPLVLGVAGALLLPRLAALGAVAALVANCKITVERAEEEI
jgi:hypothetical protein